ncbi:MAG: hypothetical protein V4547_16965 [Bacteroidota bacterium]
MIVDNGKYYVYRHLRDDKNEPFYIGIGSRSEKEIKNGKYIRGCSSRTRNKYWVNIVSKTNYTTDILIESNDRQFIESKEKEFIELYGRRDLKTGSLCNLTSGGDSGCGRSHITMIKQIQTAKNNGTYQSNANRIKKYSSKKGSNGGFLNKKTYLYSIEGWYINEFETRQKLALFLGSDEGNLGKAIKYRRSCKGYYVSDEKVKKINITLYRETKSKEAEAVKICPTTGDALAIYPSLKVAANDVGGLGAQICIAIKIERKYNGYFWSYRDTYVETIDNLYKNNKIWAL